MKDRLQEVIDGIELDGICIQQPDGDEYDIDPDFYDEEIEGESEEDRKARQGM